MHLNTNSFVQPKKQLQINGERGLDRLMNEYVEFTLTGNRFIPNDMYIQVVAFYFHII